MAVVGVLAVVIGGAGLCGSRHAPSGFGNPAGGGRSTPVTGPAPVAVGTAAPSTPTEASAPAQSPTELAIPAIAVRAPVRPVGSIDGTLQIPSDPAVVGWWAASAPPGAPAGSVVLAGHVDSTAGPGALFHLTEVRSGDAVTLTDAAHTRHAYTVTARRVVAKTAGLPADLFAADGPHRLVLITCGGQFDHATGQYRDNIVVFAEPAR